jgi:membrane protease YdiL (CAAX protease family)
VSLAPFDLFMLVLAAAVLPALSAVSGRSLKRHAASGLLRRYLYIIVRGVLISLVILAGWRWMGRPYSALGLDVPVGFPGRVGFGFDVVFFGYYAFGLFIRKLPPGRVAFAQKRLDSFRIMPRTQAQFALFPVVAIAGSVCEELLYRGFLIWLFAPIAGPLVAAAISALLFGLGHIYQGWLNVLRTAAVGLLFGAGFVLTHSLWWLIVAHVMANVFGGLFARRLTRLAPANDGSMPGSIP